MTDFDEIKKYLPKYLSREATEKLFQDLKDFPENIHNRLYGDILESEKDVFQGDGLNDMPVINLPDPQVKNGYVLVLSNTCDISPDNKRIFSPRIMYCPIVRLSNFIKVLKKRLVSEERINQFVKDVKKQEISSIFYLPEGGQLDEEYIALFDNTNSCHIKVISNDKMPEQRLFSLSNYGFYLFLFKLSIHFTRIREAVERG